MTDNPFHAPAADLVGDHDDYAPLKILTFHGRLGRMRYFVYNMIAVLIVQLLVGLLIGLTGIDPNTDPTSPNALNLVTLLAGLPIIVLGILFGIRRLHDMNLSGWFLLLALIPIVNLLLSLAMLFWPGTPGPNQYGPPPPPNSLAIKVTGSLLILLFIGGIIAAISLPAYRQYLERQGEVGLRAAAHFSSLPA